MADENFVQVHAGWQLCPKCNGDGHLGRYNSPSITTDSCPVCDVCKGGKIINVLTGLPPSQFAVYTIDDGK